jgi:hypothetical protein
MKRAFLVGALALTFASGAAAAQDIPANGMTIKEMAAWLHGAGYKAEIQTIEGKKVILSGSEGAEFRIYPNDCKGDRCSSLQFAVGFDTKGALSASKINDWNQQNRWVRAYVDKTNDPWLEYDVDLAPGSSYENLNDEFSLWKSQLTNFRKKFKL